jgi:hypothetical protein
MKKMTNLYAKAMETPVKKYRIASIKALFSLIVLLFVSSNAWSLDEYVLVTDFNSSTTYKENGLNSVSGGVFTKTENHVTFKISNLSKYSNPCLLYNEINSYPGNNSSNFTWVAQNNYAVEVSKIQIGLRGYQATTSTKPANAYFQSASITGTTVSCQTNAVGGSGAKTVEISGSLTTPTTLNMATTSSKPTFMWSTVNTEFAITQITYTYKVTHKEYLFGFDATAEANNNLYGSATAFVSQNVIQASVGVTNASTKATYIATPTTGTQFLGWFDNSSFSGTPVSTKLTYECTLDNNKAGTIVSKKLYAKFDNKLQQTITWNQAVDDKIRSNEFSLNATASSGLAVTYTATPAELVSISGNVITCLKAGTVTITANQLGNENYHPASNTPSKTFNVLEHAIITIPNASNLTYEQTLANSTLIGGVANVEGTWNWKNPNIVPIAGVSNQIAVFTPLNPIITAFPLECEVEVRVNKATPDVSCTIVDSYFVDNENVDLQTLWNCEGNGAITYTIESFVPSGINNDRATAPSIIDNRYLSLGQAGQLRIQMTVAEGSSYVGRIAIKDISIYKHANGLRCTGDTWSKTMTFDQTIETVFTANNTDYANTPILVKQTTGENIAQYESGKVKSFHNEGTATWTIWQEEDYKYEAADPKILTVNVGTAESPDCPIYLFSYTGDEMSVSAFGENRATWSKVGVAKTLYFEGRRSGGDIAASIVPYQKINGEWQKMASVKGSLDDRHPSAPFERELDPNATAIKFEKSGGVNTVYIRHVYVTSTKYFNIKDYATDEEITSLTMPTNTIGKNATTAEFYIDYSTCADEIKLHSSHPHITFGETGSTTMQFDSNESGKQKITLTYSANKPEKISVTITIYTPYEHKTITVTAETVKQTQYLIWSEGYTETTLNLPVGLEENNAAVASSSLNDMTGLNGMPVVYSTDKPEIIKISDDGLSFEIIGEGTAKLTATQAGNDQWLSVSETKTINATAKKIQVISWGQNFTRSLKIDDVITLAAEAHVYDFRVSSSFVDEERSALIKYTCPADNGVIEIVDNLVKIIGYGETTITASLAGDQDYEAASDVTKTVIVRQMSDGECENIPVYAPEEEIEFFAFDLGMPKITKDIKLPANGVPDKLTFYVRGVSYNVAIQYYKGGIDVYESTDGGNTWSDKLGGVWPEKNTTQYSEVIPLSPNATHIRFERPKGGQGYHYVGNIVVSRKQFIETAQQEIDLGNVAAGSVREDTIRFSYSDVKQNLQITTTDNANMLQLEYDEVLIDDCGATGTDYIPFQFKPTTVGQWSTTVTIKDPKTGINVPVTIKANVTEAEVFVFETEGDWATADNWNVGVVPGPNNDVLIKADVNIVGDVSIKSMAISEDKTVTVKVTGKLQVTHPSASSEKGNLILDAKLGNKNQQGASGQIVGAEYLKIQDAYFRMTFDPSGQITYGWYDFVVPFEVNIEDGIFREGNLTNSLQNGVDFIVMEHSETARAAGKKDWKVISGTMYPGKVYTITFDDEVLQNTFLFKKKESAILGGSNSFSAVCSAKGEKENRGWNGLGNGTLQHKQLSNNGKKVQMYDHTNNIYLTKEADDYIFAIGTSFFMQVEAAQEISFVAATNRPLLAPSHEARKTDEFRLALTAEGDRVTDYMWVSASEEATNEYAIGHDLLKMGTPTEAKVAQMWALKGKNNLCDIELPLVQENAYTPLSLFAPKAGTFTLTIEKMPADTKLFLTYEGNIIWDLTADAYTLDLKKGVTNNYGLLLEVNNAPQISTGVEQNQNNSKQATKVMINNQLYIITSNGAIYSVTGKKVQ